jgi:site-specific DNA-methyltransferase (adenine-specific)
MSGGGLLAAALPLPGVSGPGVPPLRAKQRRALGSATLRQSGITPPTPYYTEDGITVYNARCEDVLAAGLVPVPEVALVHADPPYGVSERTARASNGRSNATAAIDFDAVEGDDQPFDPAGLLALDRPLVLWGANHYSDRVPGSPSWITWDKKCDTTPDDNADCEHAWSNLGGPARIFRHLWRGMIKASERTSVRIGGTQKPIALSVWLFGKAKLQRGALVFVPYLGSGPDLAAARSLGLRVIACDVSEKACRVAVSARLGAAPHPEPPHTLGALFDRVKP